METQYSILYNATYPKEKLKEDFIRYFCDKIPKEYHEIVRRHIIKRFDDVSIILVPKDLKSFFIKKFELKTNNHEQAVKIYEWLENLTLMVKKSNFAFFDFYQMFLDPNKSIITETHKTAEDGVSNDTTISNKQLMEILGFDLYSTLSSTEIMKNFEEFVYWAKQLFLSQPSATKKDIKAHI